MAEPERLAALVAELRSLDRTRDAPRMREILAAAAQLVDRHAEPKKWAAFRTMFAQLSEADPAAAVAAYRDALTVWNPDSDHDPWVQCHAGIGWLQVQTQPPGSRGAEEAIAELELVIADQPFAASALALLYRCRAAGDPAENWKRRMHYLERALGQVSPAADPAGWAAIENEIGVAFGEQPGADFNQAMEKRLQCHQAAFEALGEVRDGAAIETLLNLSESYLYRVSGVRRENRQRAEECLRRAQAACNAATSPNLQRRTRLALARLIATGEETPRAPRLHEALAHLAEAAGQLDRAGPPELLANIESLRASCYLELLRLGEAQWLGPLVGSADAALRGFDQELYQNERRNALQMAGEGLLEAGDFCRAAERLQGAIAAGEANLIHATTVAGRLERIWQLADAAALLSYCRLRLGETVAALEVLERGKLRLWRAGTGRQTDVADALPALVPPGGALLFPVFAAREGAIVAVVGDGTGVRNEVVWLPKLGKQRLLELERGDPAGGELGGWLAAYHFRRSQPERWRHAVDEMGGILFREIWSPVLARLAGLGVGAGGELVWFSQAGSGILPLHAAWSAEDGRRRWLVEDHAIRYAPSVAALRSPAAAREPVLLVAHPDLKYSSLEAAWVRRSLEGRRVEELTGQAITRDAVLAALASAGTAHFATHAAFDLENPFGSWLLLANQERLTLEQLLPCLAGQPPAFVVLSACETGMTRITATPDELLGFPAAFLDHGTTTVLATLWPVEDVAAALVVGRFYRERAAGETSAAQALQRAQNWLRTVTVRELIDLLRELRDEPAPAGPLAAMERSQLRGADESSCPFAEPQSWAAFVALGR